MDFSDMTTVGIGPVHFPQAACAGVAEHIASEDCQHDHREQVMPTIGFQDSEGNEMHFALPQQMFLGLMEQMASIVERLYLP